MEFDFASQIKSRTDDELIEIYINPSLYQSEFVQAATLEATNRNLPLASLEKIKSEKEKTEVATLLLGKQGSPLYLAICFALALFGGLVGIISGYIYGFSKQTGSDGNSYFVYNESTRKYGKIIFIVGILVVLYYLQKQLLVI